MANKLYKLWSSERNPRYFRGQRVVCRFVETSQTAPHTCQVQRKPKNKKQAHYKHWYVGRIIGKGTLPGTYEILYDGDEKLAAFAQDGIQQSPWTPCQLIATTVQVVPYRR